LRDNIKGGALTETTFLILLALHSPKHGYGVLQFIEKETGGRVLLGAGTLYGAINALLKKKWIELAENAPDGKKAYALTENGRKAAAEEQKRLADIAELAVKILGGITDG
jgi:DNA-binding PadR family transcriptional regulator